MRPTPTVELFFALDTQAEDLFTLDDDEWGLLNGDGLLAGDIAVDVTGESQVIAITRGRPDELSEVSAGTCVVMWPNDLRQIDPLYEGSLFYGLDFVAKRLRVSLGTLTLFDGAVEDINFGYGISTVSTASVRAVDSLGQLARMEFDEWTTTDGELAGERILSVLDHPDVRFGANRDIDPGVSVLTSDLVSWGSNVLNYLQLVARSDLGRLYVSRDGVLTFRDRHAVVNSGIVFLPLLNEDGTPILNSDGSAILIQTEGTDGVLTDDDASILYQAITRSNGTEFLYNRISVDRTGGTKQTVHDEASQQKYGVRSYSPPTLLLDSDEAARDMAEYLLSTYSTPATRVTSVSIDVVGLRDDLTRATAAALDISDIVTVRFTPDQLGGSIVQECVVEGVAHTLAPGAHTMTLQLGRVDPRDMFILDDDDFGRLDVAVLAF